MGRTRYLPVFLVIMACSCAYEDAPEPENSMGDSLVLHSDAGSDADGDGDVDDEVEDNSGNEADSGVDSGPECEYGRVECTTDDDCCSGWLCPKLYDSHEVTSYCYPACGEDGSCESVSMQCIYSDAGAGRGVCLESAYLETEWKGLWVPETATTCAPPSYTDHEINLSVGSIDVDFTISLLFGIKDDVYGMLRIILYVAQMPYSQWQLQVAIPDDLYHQGLVDFNRDCTDDAPCGGILNEVLIDGTEVTAGYIRAVNKFDAVGDTVNQVLIDVENRDEYEMNSGSMKLLFSEYSAEISVKQ